MAEWLPLLLLSEYNMKTATDNFQRGLHEPYTVQAMFTTKHFLQPLDMHNFFTPTHPHIQICIFSVRTVLIELNMSHTEQCHFFISKFSVD